MDVAFVIKERLRALGYHATPFAHPAERGEERIAEAYRAYTATYGAEDITPAVIRTALGYPIANHPAASHIILVPQQVPAGQSAERRALLFLCAPGERIVPWDHTDVTDLFAALVALRDAWRAGRETFDVPTMTAFGRLIAEAEAAIDFGEGNR